MQRNDFENVNSIATLKLILFDDVEVNPGQLIKLKAAICPTCDASVRCNFSTCQITGSMWIYER